MRLLKIDTWWLGLRSSECTRSMKAFQRKAKMTLSPNLRVSSPSERVLASPLSNRKARFHQRRVEKARVRGIATALTSLRPFCGAIVRRSKPR